MIKLKNLWKVAMATMAMTAMLVACDEGSSKKDDNKVSATGVYTVTLPKEGVTTENKWDSTDTQHTIKIILAPRDVVGDIRDGFIENEDMLFVDENKVYVYANNQVDNGFFTKTTAKSGYVQPAGFSEYKGVAVKETDDGDYIVKVDMNQLSSSGLLLAKGTENGMLGDKGEKNATEGSDPWNAINTLVTEYVPMVLGSITFVNDNNIYPLNVWNAGVAIMEPDTEAFPTDITMEPVQIKIERTYKDFKYIVGSMTGWNWEKLSDGKYTFTAKAVPNDNGGFHTDGTTAEFKFTVDSSWGVQAGDDKKGTYSEKDYGVELKIGEMGSDQGTFTFSTTVGKTYTVTYKASDDGSSATMIFNEDK